MLEGVRDSLGPAKFLEIEFPRDCIPVSLRTLCSTSGTGTHPVFDRPRSGRLLFEQIVRDHVDLGRPQQLRLIFDSRVPPGSLSCQCLTRQDTRISLYPALGVDHASAPECGHDARQADHPQLLVIGFIGPSQVRPSINEVSLSQHWLSLRTTKKSCCSHD